MAHTTLKELKEIVDNLYEMSEKSITSDMVEIKFKTFDSNFDLNADDYQKPEKITSVEFDILNWNSVTITIETPEKNDVYTGFVDPDIAEVE